MFLQFTKMHGLGNDFMVIDAIHQQIVLSKAQIIALSRRDTGVGFDQCLLIEPSKIAGIDFFYRIFNADGQEVGQCGNGARCLARFVEHYGLTHKKSITVATNTTRMQLHINSDDTVTVDMGLPQLQPTDIPMNVVAQSDSYLIHTHNNKSYNMHAVSVGNPHAVMCVDDVTAVAVQDIGQQISEHPLFPEQTNVGFMQIITPQRVSLRVYERGCGETRACGSGAVAAVAVGRLYHNLSQEVTVSLPGGDLIVNWKSITHNILLTGPAVFIYDGRITI